MAKEPGALFVSSAAVLSFVDWLISLDETPRPMSSCPLWFVAELFSSCVIS